LEAVEGVEDGLLHGGMGEVAQMAALLEEGDFGREQRVAWSQARSASGRRKSLRLRINRTLELAWRASP